MDITSLLSSLPDNVGLAMAGLIIACKLMTVAVRPPCSDSRWLPLYRLMSTLALNIGWAANRITVSPSKKQPPKT